MSSRQLRKLQQQRELEQQAKLQEQALQDDEPQSEDEPIVATKSKASLFANLAALEVQDQDDDDTDTEAKTVDASGDDLRDPSATSTPKSTKSKGKKKKKKKPKDRIEDKAKPSKTDGDDIDAALRELDQQQSAPSGAVQVTHAVDPEYERVCQLLGINTQHLKVANEMRNLFGRTAVDAHDDENAPPGRGGRRRQRAQNQQVDLETALKGHHLPGKGLPEITLRRNNFIQGKDDWPKGTTGGLTMEVVDDKAGDGTVEFRYKHNQTYQDLQQAFHGYVEMGDPQNLIGLLTRNPYHISLLIQVSKIAKDQGDHALSSDLLERALFTFSRASLSLFNTKLSQGKARLDFARPENRELWLAAYQYIRSLTMKGTYRTALEWAKLLLGLDPEGDPYCMRLLIHHLALRAHEFNWLLDTSETILPEIWNPTGQENYRAGLFTTPSLAFAALQLREGTQTRKLLSEAMERLPWLFCHLFKELSLAAPPSIWGLAPRTDAEKLFTELYVLQTKDLWNTPEATSLLMEAAHSIKSIDVDSITKLDNSEMTIDVVRFVYLENTPGLMAMVPSQLLHRENNSDADPLPPFTNVYSYPAQRHWTERGEASGRPGLAGDFLDPMAALGRLFGLQRNPQANSPETDGGDAGDEEAVLRGRLEVMARDGPRGEDLATLREEGGEPAEQQSMARRLLNLLGWGGGEPESPGSPASEGTGDGSSEGDDDERDRIDPEDELDVHNRLMEGQDSGRDRNA